MAAKSVNIFFLIALSVSTCASKAPVVDVSLEQRGEELLCRSEGIYPQPEVSWTPSTEHHTTVETTESGLYSVVSSVRLPHSPPHEHSCNVSTLHGWRSATYRMGDGLSISENEVTIPCSDTNSTINSRVWTFNLSEIILNQTGSELVYNESWRPFVDRVSESNSLVLKNLSSDHLGLYSCVLRTDSEMYVINTELQKQDPSSVLGILLYLLVPVLLFFCVAVIGIVFIIWYQYKKADAQRNESSTEVLEENLKTNEPENSEDELLESKSQETTQENEPQMCAVMNGYICNDNKPKSGL